MVEILVFINKNLGSFLFFFNADTLRFAMYDDFIDLGVLDCVHCDQKDHFCDLNTIG